MSSAGLWTRFVQGMAGHADRLKQDSKQLHKKKTLASSKEKFIFTADIPINKQIEIFTRRFLDRGWNGNLGFKGYKGNFKIEYWINIESNLRNIRHLRSLSFVDTQLDKEHLTILLKCLQWLLPNRFDLVFKQNELDDLDVYDFIFELFRRRLRLHKLLIISNPGIYKGNLIKQLKQYLQERYANHPRYHYEIIKDKQARSLAIIRVMKTATDAEKLKQIQRTKEKIGQTFFYNLYLDSCFTKDNFEAFNYLIQLCYHDDNLEQLMLLDVSNCYLGHFASFQNICKRIATAKGLLELKLRNQPLIHIATIVEALMGDRYDQLRVNVLDISQNQAMIERAFKHFAENIVTKSCKKFINAGTLAQHLPVLVKLYYWKSALVKQNATFEKTLLQTKKIPKQNLKELDLSAVDNYNRHDLVISILKAIVFNEFSSIKKLVVQNCDIGRLNAYTETFQWFCKDIQAKQATKPIYANFKSLLTEIQIPTQGYRMEETPQKQFFLTCIFTKQGSVIEIERVRIYECFKQTNREEGFMAALAEIEKDWKEKEVKDQYTLQSFIIEKTSLSLVKVSTLILLLFQGVFTRLKEFGVHQDSLEGSFKDLVAEATPLLDAIPEGSYHNLKILRLSEIYDMNFDIVAVLKLVYHPKLRLEELELVSISVPNQEGDDKPELEALISSRIQNDKLALKKLTFGKFEPNACEKLFFDYLVFGRFCQLETLIMRKQSLKSHIAGFVQSYNESIQSGHDPLFNLTTIEVQEIDLDSKEGWQGFSELFILNNFSGIRKLTLKQVNINRVFTDGLQQQILRKIDLTKEQANQPADEFFRLNELSLDQCKIEDCDFFSLFFSNIFFKIEKFAIAKCGDLTQSFKATQTAQIENSLQEFNTFSLEEFIMQECQIKDIEIFRWLIDSIIFNEARQKIKRIHFIDCGIEDPQLNLIADAFFRVKRFHQSEKFKRYFAINEINLSKNPNISKNTWIRFFDSLQNDNMLVREEEKKFNKNFLQTEQTDITKQRARECIDTIQSTELNLQEKVICFPNIFVYKPPIQSKEVSMNFALEKVESPEERAHIYQNIIKGIILFPQNQFREVTISGASLTLFMEQVSKVLPYIHRFFEKVKKTTTPDSTIEVLKMKQMKDQNEKAMEQFVHLFLLHERSRLKELELSGSTSNFLITLLDQSKQRSQFQLNKLILLDHTEKLNSDQGCQFFHQIVLGQKFPIESLRIDKGLTIEKFNFSSLVIELKDQLFPLKELQIYCEKQADEQVDLYQQLILELLTRRQSFLEDLQIDKFDLMKRVIQEEANTTPIRLKKFQAQEIQITMGFLKFLERTRDTLETLTCTQFEGSQSDEIETYLQNYKSKPTAIMCYLSYSSVADSLPFLTEKFIFNPEFQFHKIKICKYFKSLQLPNKFNHIIWLNLSLQLLYNSSSQLAESDLTAISKGFIYNTESKLQTLILNQCHFKPPGIRALVAPYENFCKTVEEQKKQGTTYLSLKTIILYYSLYISDQGFEELQEKLFYCEYINLERLEVEVTNYNNNNALGLTKAVHKWLAFQQLHHRQYQRYLPLKHVSFGRNEFINTEEAWNSVCDTFLFSDLCSQLEVLYIHFMSHTDPIVEMIVKKALQYFNSKSRHYVWNVKRINYSLNTALSAEGWANISENLFFHPKVELEELNLVSTMLDEPSKLDSISQPLIRKALTKPNKKLKLQSFYCFNITLKNAIYDYLSPLSPDFKNLEDIQVAVDKESRKPGFMDGIPESFGEIQVVIQAALYSRPEFILMKQWHATDQIKFSPYHQDFITSFVRPINQYYLDQGLKFYTFAIDVQVLDKLAEYFYYPKTQPGKPYPYNLLFQAGFFSFQKEPSCIISHIVVLQQIVPKLEEMTQMDIYFYWKNLKSKRTSIDQVIVDYYLNDDLVEKMFEDGYSERDIISLIRIFPPNKLRIQNTLSIQAIKGIYSILYLSPSFEYSSIEYDFDNFLNIGIGYALREMIYNTRPTGCLGRNFKRLGYSFMNIFVSTIKIYKLDSQVFELNDYLSKQKLFFGLIAFTNLLFYAICIIGPIYFTKYYEGDDTSEQREKYCKQGISSYAGYLYYSFAAFTLFIEAYLFRKVSMLLSNHTEKLLELQAEDDIEKNQVAPISGEQKEQSEVDLGLKKAKSTVTKSLQDFANSSTGEWINYLLKLGLAQLAKLDLFNDISFILTTYYCEEMIVFYVSVAVAAFNNAYYFLQYVSLLYNRMTETTKTAKILQTKFINDFFAISMAGRNVALITLLDQVAPFNVSVIPNNFITRFLIPNQAGKSINNSVKNYLFKFSCEDVPQILLQSYFIVSRAISSGGNLEWNIYFTIAISLLTLVLSFVRFMSIRPSNLSQIDFDDLSEQKKKSKQAFILEHLDRQKDMLQVYCKLGTVGSENISVDHHENQNELDQLL